MRRIIILGLVGAVALGLLPASAQRDVIPPGRAWLAAAATGSSLDVVVGGSSLRLLLEPDGDLLAPSASMVDPSGRTPERARLVRGSVAGSGGWARAAVIGDRVYGQVATPSEGLVSIVPRSDGGLGSIRSDEFRRWLRAAGIDTRIEPEPDGVAEDCDSLGWDPVLADPATLMEEDPLRVFDVALALDSSFVGLHPDDWHAVALSFMATIDQLFRDAFDVRISIVHAVAIDDAAIPGTTTNVLLDSLQDHYVATYPNLARDNVHLFTGRDMTNAGGQVNCVGSAGRTTVSYSVGEGNPGGPYNLFGTTLLPDGAIKIGAHELAHTLSAHHHYANCVESVPGYDPLFTLDACTIMINDWGLIQPVFSSVSRLAVRGWADHYDI